MESTRTMEIKSSANNTSVFYNNHEVWISSVDTQNDIAQVLDLVTGETYVVHCRKLSEQNNGSNSNMYSFNSFH
jgi:H-type small acid-soluble spore protein